MKKYFVYWIIIIFITILVWQILLPRNPAFQGEIIFTIEKGDGSREIAYNLEKEKLIWFAPTFRIYVLTIGVSGKLQAGSYLLSPSMGLPEIVGKLVRGDIAKRKITIPEGFTLQQIEEKLNIKIDPGMEGFLFPDTYYFSYNATEEEIIKAIQDNFEKKITQDLREEIRKQDKTISEIIAMASLIEKEIKEKGDKELVSGILWKRLEVGMALQVDAAPETYKVRGLPEKPICNPGLESIRAAIYPESSQNWYYLSTPAGETIFSKTLEEHNIAKYDYLK